MIRLYRLYEVCDNCSKWSRDYFVTSLQAEPQLCCPICENTTELQITKHYITPKDAGL